MNGQDPSESGADRSRLNWLFGLALLAAVAGLMYFIIRLAFPPTPAPKVEPVAATDRGPPAVPALAKPCYQSSVKVLKEVPLSLFSATSTVDGLNWVRVEVRNECREPLNIKVTLRRQSSLENPRQDVTFDGNLLETYLQPGQQMDKSVTPAGIQLLRARFANTVLLNLTWEIRNVGDGQLLAKDTQEVKLLPRDVILWDLQTVADRPLSKAVILASLANWISEAGPATSKLARELITGLTPGHPQGDDSWVKRLYEYFLDPGSPHRLAVQSADPSWNSLAPSGQQTVRVAEDLINGGQAVTPWELAMLFATMAQASGRVADQMAVVALRPDAGGESPPVLVLFGWSADGLAWKGLAMNGNANTDFDANVAAASALLKRRLDADPGTRAALQATGSVFAADLDAVNLGVAKSHYGMRGFP